MAKLTVYHGDGVKGLFKIRKELVTIGRVADCDVEISANSVSRHHAKVERRLSGYYIIDNNSTNGTLVNGKEITEKRLTDGDEIYMGDVVVLFSYDEWEYEDTKREVGAPTPEEEVLQEIAASGSPQGYRADSKGLPRRREHTTTTTFEASALKKRIDELKKKDKK